MRSRKAGVFLISFLVTVLPASADDSSYKPSSGPISSSLQPVEIPQFKDEVLKDFLEKKNDLAAQINEQNSDNKDPNDFDDLVAVSENSELVISVLEKAEKPTLLVFSLGLVKKADDPGQTIDRPNMLKLPLRDKAASDLGEPDTAIDDTKKISLELNAPPDPAEVFSLISEPAGSSSNPTEKSLEESYKIAERLSFVEVAVPSLNDGRPAQLSITLNADNAVFSKLLKSLWSRSGERMTTTRSDADLAQIRDKLENFRNEVSMSYTDYQQAVERVPEARHRMLLPPDTLVLRSVDQRILPAQEKKFQDAIHSSLTELLRELEEILKTKMPRPVIIAEKDSEKTIQFLITLPSKS